MKRHRLFCVCFTLALLALAAGLSRCASTSLKGAPFYTTAPTATCACCWGPTAAPGPRDSSSRALEGRRHIPYDRKAAQLRKVSFLWRGFRYERKDGQKAVDLLFLPVWRTRWAE